MTALHEYERLEASGLWRAGPDAQRRDVIVSIGDATLIVSDMNDQALAHWSLPAVQRLNPGERPAVFCPDGDPDETLEIADSDGEMIDAIEKLRAALRRGQPHPGRLRLIGLLLSAAAILALVVFWLPDALLRHTVSVVPKAKRQDIGALILTESRRLTGPPCASPLARQPLNRLRNRLEISRLQVLRGGVRETATLPGGIVLINRALVEDHEEPDVVAGYLLAEKLRSAAEDPLERFLRLAGLRASFRLLTTGEVTVSDARAHAEWLLAAPGAPVATNALIEGFERYALRSSPYAYAVDVSGETTLALIEADAFLATTARPALSDGDWVALQGICEN